MIRTETSGNEGAEWRIREASEIGCQGKIRLSGSCSNKNERCVDKHKKVKNAWQ